MRVLLVCLLCVAPCFLPSASAQPPPGVCTRKKQQVCVANATCIDSRCVCGHGLKGDGRFECVLQDESVCQLSEDPRIFAYEGARARIYTPCRYRLTRFTTNFHNSRSVLQFCEFEVFSFNKIVDGRHFVGGLEIKLFIYDSGIQQAYQQDFLKFDLDAGGIHSGPENILRWGSSSYFDWKGVGINCTFDLDQKFAILDIKQCGVRFKYRPYNPLYPVNKQHYMPGLSIKAPVHASFSVRNTLDSFPPNVLCGRTSAEGDDNQIFDRVKTQLGFRKRHQKSSPRTYLKDNIVSTVRTIRLIGSQTASADTHLNVPGDGRTFTKMMLYSVLQQRLPQELLAAKTSELLPAASQCTAAFDLFANCPANLKSSAIRACSGVIKNKKTVTCLSDNPMNAFNGCLQRVCGGNLCAYNFKQVTGCHVPFTLSQEKKKQCQG